MRSTGYSIRVSLEFGSSTRLRAERGILDEDIDAVSCPDARVSCCTDTVLCMQFSLVINIWSLTFMIGKGPIVFCISFLYVVVTTLSVSVTGEAANGGFSR